MNLENLKLEIRQIESRHKSPVAARSEIFQFVRGVLVQIEGPVEPEVKETLRHEWDRAQDRALLSIKKHGRPGVW